MGAAVRITHSMMENLANVTQMPMGKAPVALPLKGGVEIVMPIANVLAVKTSQVCKNINLGNRVKAIVVNHPGPGHNIVSFNLCLAKSL